MKTREQAEARAWELYPEIKIKGEPVLDELWNEVLDDENKGKRQSFLQCWEEMQHDKSELYDGTLLFRSVLNQMHSFAIAAEKGEIDPKEFAEYVRSSSERLLSSVNKQTCGFCVEPASKTIKEAFDKIPKDVRDRHAKAAYNEHKLLREAAEKVVDYALYGGLGVNLHDAIVELEKALK